jgi:hypothetical protein
MISIYILHISLCRIGDACICSGRHDLLLQTGLWRPFVAVNRKMYLYPRLHCFQLWKRGIVGSTNNKLNEWPIDRVDRGHYRPLHVINLSIPIWQVTYILLSNLPIHMAWHNFQGNTTWRPTITGIPAGESATSLLCAPGCVLLPSLECSKSNSWLFGKL